MSNNEWYIERNGGSAGPFTGAQLKELAASGRLQPNDAIRKGLNGNAVAASRIKGLFVETASATRPAGGTLVADQPTPQNGFEDNPAPPQPPPLPPASPPGRSSSTDRFAHFMDRAKAAVTAIRGVTPRRVALVGVVGCALLLVGVVSGLLGLGGRGDSTGGSSTTSAGVPDFADVDYSYDFSKDDYKAIPAGATRHIQERIIESGDESLIGKPETDEGYIASDGRFVDHGKFVTWSDDSKTGKLREGWMLHGKLHGVMVLYYPNGQKQWEQTFVRGNKHGIQRFWYESGERQMEVPYLDGDQHGVSRGWHENGVQEYENTWVRGERHGPSRQWYKSGSPEFVAEYRNDKRHGSYVKYSDGGDDFALESGSFEDGKPVGTWRFGFTTQASGERYYVEVPAGPWRGGTQEQFITKMKLAWLIDGNYGTFLPRDRIATYESPSRDHFFTWFGHPDSDEPHPSILDRPRSAQWSVRQWTYRCSDGPLSMKVQVSGVTDATGPIIVTIRP